MINWFGCGMLLQGHLNSNWKGTPRASCLPRSAPMDVASPLPAAMAPHGFGTPRMAIETVPPLMHSTWVDYVAFSPAEKLW